MKANILMGSVLALAIIVLGAAVLMRAPTAPTVTSIQTPSQSTTSSYTMAQVKGHNNATSCWAVINAKVYDLTNWVNQHPGGPERILSICGTDGSVAFNAQHGGQSQPAAELAQFYIGELSS